MRVDYMLLAEAARADSDRHHIFGGGWDVVTADRPPARLMTFGVAVRLSLDAGERGREVDLALDIVDPEGSSMLARPVSGRVTAPAAQSPAVRLPARLYLAFTVNDVTFPRSGTHAVVLHVDGAERAREEFQVITGPPPVSEVEVPAAPAASAEPPNQPATPPAAAAQGVTPEKVESLRAWLSSRTPPERPE